MTSTNVLTAPGSRILNIFLWTAQVMLAAAFLMAGVPKAFVPIPELAEQLVWTGAVSSALVRFIGVTEIIAGIGLILPSLLRIKPVLTVWAAAGLVVVMIMAIIFHFARGEMFAIPINLGFALLAGFVVWGRNKQPVTEA